MAAWSNNSPFTKRKNFWASLAFAAGVVLSVLLFAAAIGYTGKLAIEAKATTPQSSDPAPIPAQFGDTGVRSAANCVAALDDYVQSVTIYFALGEDVLDKKYYPALLEMSDRLDACPEAEIYIFGHADNTGDDIINTEISLRRAVSVEQFLASASRNTERFRPLLPGQFESVNVGDLEDFDEALDRRVDFRAISLPKPKPKY